MHKPLHVRAAVQRLTSIMDVIRLKDATMDGRVLCNGVLIWVSQYNFFPPIPHQNARGYKKRETWLDLIHVT